jgi:hypothetical protein
MVRVNSCVVGYTDKYPPSTPHADIHAIMAPAVLENLDGPQTRLKILPAPFISSSTFFTPTPFEKLC